MEKQDNNKDIDVRELELLVYLETYICKNEILKLLEENDYSDDVVMFINNRFLLPPELIELIAKKKGITATRLIRRLIVERG